MRRPLSSKPRTCTEGTHVYAAGISAKVGAHYPERSSWPATGKLVATDTERQRDGRAEVSRGHSRLNRPSPRPERVVRERSPESQSIQTRGRPGPRRPAPLRTAGDGIPKPVTQLRGHLKGHWPRIKEDLLGRQYQPAPVRKAEIPKPGGGMRGLGIPTVQDRPIQQALSQVLGPTFEPGFSEHSYGFRPGRSAHQAVLKARSYVAEGRRFVVDLDLEKFFDRVNHDMLMSRVALKVRDKRVLKLTGRYLRAGMFGRGLTQPRTEGTPQGGPLSPLLSNILLSDLDRELKRRGHAFCRYADDLNIYVRTRRSAERVMASITRFLEQQLRLKVNRAKSAVAWPVVECRRLAHEPRPAQEIL